MVGRELAEIVTRLTRNGYQHGKVLLSADFALLQMRRVANLGCRRPQSGENGPGQIVL